MNILSLSRSEVVAFVESGFFNKTDLKHYDVCKKLQEGKTQSAIAEEFNFNGDRHVRAIKEKKCPDCGKTRNIR